MHLRIYLIGFMGSGKTTAGKRLARALDYAFTDLDSMIEERYHVTIPSLFEKYDEHAFRTLEHETLKDTLTLPRHVIATGGGTPCFFNNMELINGSGISVYLRLSPASLHQRLLNSKKKRPLIQRHPPAEVLDYIKRTLDERDPYYLRAHHIVKGEDLDIGALCRLLDKKEAT